MITITIKIMDLGCAKKGRPRHQVEIVAKTRRGRLQATQNEKFASWLLRRVIARAVKDHGAIKNSAEAHEYYMRNGGEMIASE